MDTRHSITTSNREIEPMYRFDEINKLTKGAKPNAPGARQQMLARISARSFSSTQVREDEAPPPANSTEARRHFLARWRGEPVPVTKKGEFRQDGAV
jgi:hypothetical protein